MGREISNHGPDSITSTPAIGIVPDSIASISSTTVVPDSITSTPAIGIVPDSVASISSVAIGPDSITSKEVPTSRLKRKCQHPALPLHPYSLKSTEEEVPASTPIPSMAIGPKEWTQYFGEVGTSPPLPADIDAILDSPCSFWPGKQVKDTHLLVLVPATVDGRPFTLDLLGELIKDPQGGFRKAEFEIYGNEVRRELGAQSPGSSYWVLMTRDVLPGSRGKTYDAQKALVAAHVHYDIPYVLEAATAILLHHARIGERLYTDDPWTYTRCQEKVLGNKYPVVVGGFSSGGFLVLNYYFYSVYSSSFGVSCLRKF
jgi:hypothetical protein